MLPMSDTWTVANAVRKVEFHLLHVRWEHLCSDRPQACGAAYRNGVLSTPFGWRFTPLRTTGRGRHDLLDASESRAQTRTPVPCGAGDSYCDDLREL